MIKKLFRWQKGKQNSGYEKMLLAGSYWSLKFDFYLLKFKTGSVIPKHKDPVAKGKHFRLNIILQNAIQGGDFICDKIIYKTNQIKYFRPDLHEHSVTEIKKGTRYVLSIGWVKK